MGDKDSMIFLVTPKYAQTKMFFWDQDIKTINSEQE